MAKATKSSQRKPAKGHPVGPVPMTGFEKAAWWSVPLTGIVGLICASTLGVLFAIQPASTTNQTAANGLVAGKTNNPQRDTGNAAAPESKPKRSANKPAPKSPEPTNPKPAKSKSTAANTGKPADGSGAIRYEYFEGDWDRMPDFDSLTPTATGELDSFVLTPAQQEDQFAFRYTAKLNITEAGEYIFYTASDDGSKLFVDGEQVVENDGLHSHIEQSGKKQLGVGEHELVVTYFDKSKNQSLAVQWEGPNFPKEGIADSAALIPATTSPASVAVPNPNASIALDANTVTAIRCSDGKILFEGDTDIQFIENQPSFETTEEGGVEFSHLSFNGSDQSAELPNIPKDQGTLELVVKMPDRATSIFLDSNFQRLTLRKNRDGLRWRIAATKKQNKIRTSPTSVDFKQWHHIAITWKSGGEAALFVDGVEHDRIDYVNEQPHFSHFQKIVLGRTRMPQERFYEIRVHRYAVFDQQLTPQEIAQQNDALRETYPFIFE